MKAGGPIKKLWIALVNHIQLLDDEQGERYDTFLLNAKEYDDVDGDWDKDLNMKLQQNCDKDILTNFMTFMYTGSLSQ